MAHFSFRLLFISICTFVSAAHASDWRVGTSIGYGGAGITSPTTVKSSVVNVQRSEGPGVFSIFADLQTDDKRLLTFEHSRGFRFGPFSSGVSFTGAAYRWYFSQVPAVAKNPDQSTLLVKRYVFFFGLGGGVAHADIQRKNDLVPSVSGSGVYAGIKFGADYQIRPGYGIRPEIITNTTIMSNVSPSQTVSEFALQCAFWWML